MSLHLIESRAQSGVAVLRRPGAKAVSVVMHAVLVSMAVLATASPPAFLRDQARVIDHVVYVAPKSPPMAQPSRSTPSSSSATVPTNATLPPLLAPIEIPTNIPTVPEVMATPARDANEIFGRAFHGQGRDGGTSLDGGGGNNDIFEREQVDVPVLALSCAPPPRYPDALRMAGIQDTLLATFVVDSVGHMEPASLTFAGSPLAAFVASVREALHKSCYRPAEAGGRRVRQLVKQAFVFSLNR